MSRRLYPCNEQSNLVYEVRAFDPDGNLVWSSLWLRKTTKAWMFLAVALVALLLVLWIERRSKKVRNNENQ